MGHGQCDKHKNRKGKEQPVWRFGMDGKIILKQIVEKQHVMTLTGFIWFWRGPAKTFLNKALNLFLMQKVGNSLTK
jgi:hypothetical protein